MFRSTYKKGTIGYTIDKLAHVHGDTRVGIFILEQALLQACKVDGTVKIDDTLILDTPGYQQAKAREKMIWK